MLLIDAHVHIYDCFDHRRVFDAAFHNFSRAAGKHGRGQQHIPLLLLTEGRREKAFRNLSGQRNKRQDRIGGERNGGYRVSATEEAESLKIEKATGESLFLISGRQVATSEGLEVLVFATSGEIPEGLPLAETIDAALKQGAPAVIPWGFGKWYGNRGKVLREFLGSWRSGNVFLGDNGGRPAFIRLPDFPRDDDVRPLQVLPGSDPLPLPDEVDRIGGFGFILREEIDPLRPAGSLKRILSGADLAPIPYGSPEKPLRFARNQFRLRLWKHRT